MAYFIGEDLVSSERFVYVYSGLHPADLEQTVDATMKSLGYKHLGMGVYQYGSFGLRLLLGGFYKYFKFKVTLDAEDMNNIRVGLKKESSGMSGGLLGVKRMNDEMKRLKNVFQQI
ncbi:hypothetical protein [Dysgonomonas sp. 25]|uniref:hypothetical protein n=1 Tax=Dysgonomonas sp. 25 TaxID=2302933 RepID=UPI0013CF6EC7|nr:hypothetical protein [Dysgonomonas sp. 25]NDV67664.1 hypothetical protein [Dysgonomonas sp. 25]